MWNGQGLLRTGRGNKKDKGILPNFSDSGSLAKPIKKKVDSLILATDNYNMKKNGNSKKTTIDDLAVMVAGGFKRVDERFEQVDQKIDLLRAEVKNDMSTLRNDMDGMFNHYIGTFRKDFDDLAGRVKKLEEMMMNRK